MRRALILVAVAGCRAGSPAQVSQPTASYQTHVSEAEELERAATQHEEAAEVARQRGATYQCDTAPESEQATSGTERFYGTRICSDVALDDRRRHEKEAKELRAKAERHRSAARTILDAERAACAGYELEQVRDTPLGRTRGAQVEDIDGGVRILLPAGPGLALDEVRREVACHRARAALYDAEDYMPHDPALVPATRVSVDGAGGGGIVITIHGDDPVATDLARKRAWALVNDGR
jgi:hypothetical protein